MYWVIQSNMYSEANFEHLLTALGRLDLPHSVHKVIPFDGGLEPECSPPPGSVIVMGTLTLCRIAKARGWRPGSFDNENHNYRVQVDHWGEAMLNSDALFCKFGEVPEQRVPFFIRPVADSKAFTGEVSDWPSYVEWRRRVADLKPEDGATLALGTEVMVCRTKEIHREHRLFMVRGRCVTASQYKLGILKCVDSNVDDAVVRFGEEVSSGWAPAEAYALDVADTPDGLRVIEVNCINSAGWYGADMNKLVEALDRVGE